MFSVMEIVWGYISGLTCKLYPKNKVLKSSSGG